MNLDHNRSTFFIRLFIKSFVYFPLCVMSVMLLLMFYSCFYSFCTNRLNLSNHTGSFHWSLSCLVLPIVPEWNTSPLFQNWNQICFTSLIHFWRLCSFFQHNRAPSPSLLCVCVRMCVCCARVPEREREPLPHSLCQIHLTSHRSSFIKSLIDPFIMYAYKDHNRDVN